MSIKNGNSKGRPPKKKGSNAVGRPKGEAGIMREYKERMLRSPKSERVLTAIFDAALNDEHKHQAAAWKLIMDRMLPTGMFEQDVMKNGGKSAIQINITGLGETKVEEGTVYDNDDIEDVDES